MAIVLRSTIVIQQKYHLPPPTALLPSANKIQYIIVNTRRNGLITPEVHRSKKMEKKMFTRYSDNNILDLSSITDNARDWLKITS